MKIGILICVLVLTVSATPFAVEPRAHALAFEKARVLAGDKDTFYLFSTSRANYVIRHDGFAEAALHARRQLFHLKLGKIGRIEQVYFYDYQSDLVLLYEVSDGNSSIGYVMRMNQQSKKRRWLTSIEADDIGPCTVEGNEAHCGATDDATKIDLNTGAYLHRI